MCSGEFAFGDDDSDNEGNSDHEEVGVLVKRMFAEAREHVREREAVLMQKQILILQEQDNIFFLRSWESYGC